MVLVKISGATNRNDAEAIAEIADMMGISVGSKKSDLRTLEAKDAVEITKGLGIKKVLLAHPEGVREITLLAESIKPHFVEISNGLSPAEVRRVHEKTEVIKWFDLEKKEFEDIKDEIEDYRGAYSIIMLDTGIGPAMKINWEIASKIKDEFYPEKLMITGGLTPDNVAKAIKRVKPWGVDVNAGVERKPGKKSFEKMRHFCRVVRRFSYKY